MPYNLFGKLADNHVIFLRRFPAFLNLCDSILFNKYGLDSLYSVWDFKNSKFIEFNGFKSPPSNPTTLSNTGVSVVNGQVLFHSLNNNQIFLLGEDNPQLELKLPIPCKPVEFEFQNCGQSRYETLQFAKNYRWFKFFPYKQGFLSVFFSPVSISPDQQFLPDLNYRKTYFVLHKKNFEVERIIEVSNKINCSGVEVFQDNIFAWSLDNGGKESFVQITIN